MKKLLTGALLCTLSLALFSQEVKIGESCSGEATYANKPAHITISPDAESPRHFHAFMILDRGTHCDTLDYRFFTELESFPLSELSRLELDEKILRDGRCISKYPQDNDWINMPYKMGKLNGTAYLYEAGALFSKKVFKEDKEMSEKVFYPSGKIWADIVNEYEGNRPKAIAVVEYYESGKVKREEVYSWGNEFIHYKNYTEAEKDTLFAYPFNRPVASFPGGPNKLKNFLANNLRYPAEAVKNGIQGRVIVNYWVETDGSIVSVVVPRGRGLSPECYKEAVRVVKKMPKYIPATQYGEPIRTPFTLPVSFRLR